MRKLIFFSLLTITLNNNSNGQTPYLLSDSYAGPGNGSALQFSPAKLNNIFIYTGNDTINGAALWRTDGTPAGTYMIKDFNPSSNLPGATATASGTVINNRLIFTQYTSTEGNERWTTDGTVAGTEILKDIKPGPASSNSSFPSSILYNNIYYFNAIDTLGLGLWQSDGTPAGTHKVNSSIPLDSGVASLFIVNNKLTFLKSVGWPPVSHLFSLDNTSGNPVVTDITPPLINLQTFGQKEIYNGILYFVAGYHSANDRALFRTDGTQAGTYFVHQFDTRTNSVINYYDQLNSNQVLIFASNDSLSIELFSLDLTTETCSLVKDIWPGYHPSFGAGFTSTLVTSFNKMFFYANDSVHGSEPWVSDGTTAGTFMLKDIDPSNSNAFINTGPPFEEFNSRVLFNETNMAYGEEWYTTDGTVAGTDTLINFAPLSENGYLASGRMFKKNNLYFISGLDDGAPPPFASDVFYTDGSSTGTHRLDICPDIQCSASPFYIGTDSVNHYFWAADMTHGQELWKSDGNPSNTMMITDFSPGSSPSMPTFHNDNDFSFFYNNEMYFKMNGAYPGVDEELWKINGVTNVFTQVSNFDSDTISFGSFRILDGRYVIFPVETDSLGIELWAIDLPGITNSIASPLEWNTRIYPNPTAGIINIEFSNDFNGEINILDLLGRSVNHKIMIGNKIQIDITNNSEGMYVIQFVSKDKTWSEKIIIRH